MSDGSDTGPMERARRTVLKQTLGAIGSKAAALDTKVEKLRIKREKEMKEAVA